MPSRRRALTLALVICLSLTTGVAAVTQTSDEPVRLEAEQDEPFNVTVDNNPGTISTTLKESRPVYLVVQGDHGTVNISSPAANTSRLVDLFTNASVVGDRVRVLVPPNGRIAINARALDECIGWEFPLRVEDPETDTTRTVQVRFYTDHIADFADGGPTVFQKDSVVLTYLGPACEDVDRIRILLTSLPLSGDDDRIRGAVTVIDEHEDGVIDQLHVRVNTSRSDASMFEPARGDAIVDATVTGTSSGPLPQGRYGLNWTSTRGLQDILRVLAPLNDSPPTTTMEPTATTTTTTISEPTTTSTPTTEPTSTTTSTSQRTTRTTASTPSTTTTTTTTLITSPSTTTTTPSGQPGFTLALALLAVIGVAGLAVGQR